MNTILQIAVLWTAVFYSFISGAQILKEKAAPADPAEIIATADNNIARALSSQFSNPTVEKFTVSIADRVKACPKAPKQCLDTSKWVKWSCQGGFEEQLPAFYNLWNSIGVEVKTEAQAKALWDSLKTCSKKPSAVQTAMALLLAKVFYMKNYTRLMDGEVWPWIRGNLATRPNPPEFAIPFVTRIVADAEMMRPTPYTILGSVIEQALKWPAIPADAKLDPAVITAWIKNMSRAIYLSGKASLIPDFIDANQAQLTVPDLQANSTIIVYYCRAVRSKGVPEACEALIKRRFSGVAHMSIELERGLTKFYAGDLAGASGQLAAAATAPGKSGEIESLLHVETARVASFQGKHAEALKAVDAAAYPEQLTTEKIEAGAVKVGILRRAGQLDAAAKLLEQLRTTAKQVAQGSFTPAMYLEYEAVLLALKQKDLAKLKAAAAALKTRMSGDPTQVYFAAAAAAAEKKSAKLPATAELAKLEKAGGAGSPYSKEFAELYK